jgi:hypothetical protein
VAQSYFYERAEYGPQREGVAKTEGIFVMEANSLPPKPSDPEPEAKSGAKGELKDLPLAEARSDTEAKSKPEAKPKAKPNAKPEAKTPSDLTPQTTK